MSLPGAPGAPEDRDAAAPNIGAYSRLIYDRLHLPRLAPLLGEHRKAIDYAFRRNISIHPRIRSLLLGRQSSMQDFDHTRSLELHG